MRLTHAFNRLKSLLTSSPPMNEEVGFYPFTLKIEEYEPLVFNDQFDRTKFLQEMHHIRENRQLMRLIFSLSRQQVDYGVLYASNMEEVNGSRLTVNGFHIIEREIEKYAAEYDEMHARGDEFDQHEILNG